MNTSFIFQGKNLTFWIWVLKIHTLRSHIISLTMIFLLLLLLFSMRSNKIFNLIFTNNIISFYFSVNCRTTHHRHRHSLDVPHPEYLQPAFVSLHEFRKVTMDYSFQYISTWHTVANVGRDWKLCHSTSRQSYWSSVGTSSREAKIFTDVW